MCSDRFCIPSGSGSVNNLTNPSHDLMRNCFELMKKVPSFAAMRTIKEKYMASLMRLKDAELLVHRLFRRFFGENYAFGFAFQSTSRDFIPLAPNPSH